MSNQASAASPGHVWIVDSSKDSTSVADALRRRGHDVRTFTSAEALRAAGDEGRPHVVLVDPAAETTAIEALLHDAQRRLFALILWTDAASDSGSAAAWAYGVDDHLSKRLIAEDTAIRVELAMRRTHRQLETSPLTGLPGNSVIRRELEQRIQSGESFAVIHCDLDHFKSFNDYYGFVRGDAVISFCAACLNQASDHAEHSPFLGHVGGDDFVAVLPSQDMPAFCEAAIEYWDSNIGEFYDAADRRRGWIESVDRRGNTQTFPIMSLSLGVATNTKREFSTPWHAAAIAAELKEYAKRQPGSNYQVDRRV